MTPPEVPLMIFPSHAKRYGVEGALLLAMISQKVQLSASAQVTQSREQWRIECGFWTSEQFERILQRLVEAEAVNAVYHLDHVTIGFKPVGESKPRSPVDESIAAPSKPVVNDQVVALQAERRAQSARPEVIQKLPVYDSPPVPVPTVAAANTLKGRGPAPTFGGSIGWKKRSSDELHQVFAQQEELNKQLFAMTMDWQPSSMFFSTLARNNIPREFAQRCLDEFVLYYSDGKKKERSWDQKFLAWVKRDWVKQQSKDSRNSVEKQSSGYQNENSQRDTREKRKRITAAIMDINDTNW